MADSVGGYGCGIGACHAMGGVAGWCVGGGEVKCKPTMALPMLLLAMAVSYRSAIAAEAIAEAVAEARPWWGRTSLHLHPQHSHHPSHGTRRYHPYPPTLSAMTFKPLRGFSMCQWWHGGQHATCSSKPHYEPNAYFHVGSITVQSTHNIEVVQCIRCVEVYTFGPGVRSRRTLTSSSTTICYNMSLISEERGCCAPPLPGSDVRPLRSASRCLCSRGRTFYHISAVRYL